MSFRDAAFCRNAESNYSMTCFQTDLILTESSERKPVFFEIDRGRRVMKVAQVAPLYESVPPKFYGGTERIVSYLTDGLVCQGHDVTLYASADSVTLAELRPVCEKAL
jgi:hypothetical protein